MRHLSIGRQSLRAVGAAAVIAAIIACFALAAHAPVCDGMPVRSLALGGVLKIAGCP